MNMKRFVKFFLVSGFSLPFLVNGCSSSNSSPGAIAGAAGDSTTGGHAGSGAHSGMGGVAGVLQDAGQDVAPSKQLGKDIRNAFSAKSCADICGAWNKLSLSCGASCKDQSYLGYATYKDSAKTKVELSDCSTVPPSKHNGYSLSSVSCCCDSPHIKKSALAPATQTCNEICGAAGLGCDDEYPWPTVNGDVKAGAKVTYRSAAGSTTYGYSSCAGIPSPTKKVQNTVFDIHRYTCVCIDSL